MIHSSRLFALFLLVSAMNIATAMDNYHRINRDAFSLEDTDTVQNYKKEKELARHKKTRQKKHQPHDKETRAMRSIKTSRK